jgi:class 3 adenylate cyclase
MAHPEDHPSEEPEASPTLPEEYSKALRRLSNSLVHQRSFAASEDFIRALSGIRDSAESQQRAFQKAIESLQPSYAPFRLRTEISALENKAHRQAEEISKHTADKKKAAQEIDKLRGIIDELNSKQGIQHLLSSVAIDAHEKIESDADFRLQFTSDAEVDAFVVSVDIRRSTELMLKARSPKLFADFITTLCGDLEDIFKRNRAVVDKFTGDGILAFFPEFFSGPDAGYLALRAAKEANEAFSRRYREFRTSFTTILNDVGLGTGIDYGKVHQVRMAGALTIVGQPVVYACRMGGAPAGKILMNQPAFEVVSSRYENHTIIKETLITIKAEGDLVAYDVQLLDKEYDPQPPNWIPDRSKE